MKISYKNQKRINFYSLILIFIIGLCLTTYDKAQSWSTDYEKEIDIYESKIENLNDSLDIKIDLICSDSVKNLYNLPDTVFNYRIFQNQEGKIECELHTKNPLREKIKNIIDSHNRAYLYCSDELHILKTKRSNYEKYFFKHLN
jgi:hypothetical protein